MSLQAKQKQGLETGSMVDLLSGPRDLPVVTLQNMGEHIPSTTLTMQNALENFT